MNLLDAYRKGADPSIQSAAWTTEAADSTIHARRIAAKEKWTRERRDHQLEEMRGPVEELLRRAASSHHRVEPGGSQHRVHIFTRDEIGLVCLPTQLERTLHLYW
jgi:hypothetical protein